MALPIIDLCPYCKKPGFSDPNNTVHAACRATIDEREQSERLNVPVTRQEFLQFLLHFDVEACTIDANNLMEKWRIKREYV
jgi:hypothetical protein